MLGTTDKESAYEEAISLCAYKPESEVNSEERRVRAIEKQRCKTSFLRFLKWCKIVEPPTLNNPGGVIDLQLWPHIKEMVATVLTKVLAVVLKSRQIGISWFLSAYDLWYAMSHQGATVMIFSKGEIEAIEKLAKCRRIYSQLPDFMKLKLGADSATEMSFPIMTSSIKAFAATESAGISFTASVLDIDEWADHPYAEENYIASKPTRDAGGQFIGVFTMNPWKLDTLASVVFQDAMAGKNDFTPLFFPYDVRPGRDEKWYERTKRNIPDRELRGLTPDLYMQKNYPCSMEEALRPSQTIQVFDTAILDQMMEKTDNPIKIVRDGIDSQIVKIYQNFHIGEYYIAATDASHGIGKDYSVTTIMNVKTGAIVADIMNNLLPPEELALHSVRLLEIYHNPLWYPEDNEWGRVVITVAQNLGYKRFGYQDAKKTKLGWHTDEKTRLDLFGGLIPAINNHLITIYNAEGLKQFYNIIRNASKNGRIEATGTRHDDYPFAVGICWAKKGEIQTEVKPLEPIETLHFRNRSSQRWRR